MHRALRPPDVHFRALLLSDGQQEALYRGIPKCKAAGTERKLANEQEIQHIKDESAP